MPEEGLRAHNWSGLPPLFPLSTAKAGPKYTFFNLLLHRFSALGWRHGLDYVLLASFIHSSVTDINKLPTGCWASRNQFCAVVFLHRERMVYARFSDIQFQDLFSSPSHHGSSQGKGTADLVTLQRHP